MFCLCKALCLVDLRICVYLNRTKPWLELSIKFNQYSIRSFQKALVGFHKLWINLVFKEFNWVSMSKIPYPPFQMESWTRCLGGLIFCSSRKNCICFFQFPFWFILQYCIFDLCTIVLMKGFSLRFFSLSKRVELCSKFVFFNPCHMEGPIKSRFSVCLFVCLSAVWNFYQEWIGSFFQIFCAMVDNWNI